MSSAPARPASAPDSAIPSQMRREEGMPLAWAASRPAPPARHSKPRTVRVRRNQTPAAKASARGNPRSSRLPANSRGNQAEALTGSVPAMLTVAPDPAAASGPATSHPCTRWMAIQLSRIVLITSCTPRRTFNQPASNPHPAPATAAPSRLRAIAPGTSRCPITAAARAPQMSWPSAPMLNRPTVNATATESPVSTRMADLIAVSPSGPGPPNAPENRSAKPVRASRPEAAMATKLISSERISAAKAPQNVSRAGADSRARSSGKRGHLAEHHAAELVVGRVRQGLAGGAALEEHQDAIAERAQLVEIERDHQDGGAPIAGIAQRIVQPPRRSRVESPGRVDGDDQARRRAARELPRGDELLLVAAGKFRGSRGRLRWAHVESGDQLARHPAPAGALDEAAPRIRRRRLAAQRQVFFHAERQAEGAAAGILGKVRNSRAARRRRIAVKGRVIIESERSLRWPQSRQDLGELGLAVAVHTGHPQDLAAADIERQPAERRPAALRRADELARLENDCAVSKRPPCLRRAGGPAARHRLGQRQRVSLRALRHLHEPAPPDHRDPIRGRQHLAELVRDEEDRPPLGGERAHGCNQPGRLQRRE